MRIAVLGGAGFLGSHVADALTQQGHEVVIFDCRKSPYRQEHQTEVTGNILDKSAVMEVVSGCDAVYHFAGLADLNQSLNQPEKTIRLNVMGTLNVLEACRNQPGLKQLVFASSAYVFSAKGSFYGISKKCCEQMIEEYGREWGVPYTILRYGSVYGPRADDQNRVYRIVRQALREGRLSFTGSGDEEREYIHVKDAARLSVEVLGHPEFIGQHVILTGVERFKYLDLLHMVQEMLNHRVEVELYNEEYKGHYRLTPYTFSPTPGRKLVSNPYVDFGQGLLEVMEDIYIREQLFEVSESGSSSD